MPETSSSDCTECAPPSAAAGQRSKPETLSSSDHLNVEQRRSDARWQAFTSFHRAPCLRPSLGIGALGGLGIGMIRYLGGAGGRAAFTWGSTVAGCLYGSSWYVCRRAMYARLNGDGSADADLLTRVQAGDREAMIEYRKRLEARAAKSQG